MALIRCPDCNRLVSSKAAACPRCARPIAGQVEDPESVSKGLFLLDVALGPFGCFACRSR